MAKRTGDYGELSATARQRHTTPQALLQRRRAAAGQCARCGRKRESGLTWYCRACTDDYATWRTQWLAERREQGLCRCGRDLGGHTSRCATCLERETAARKAKRKRTRP